MQDMKSLRRSALPIPVRLIVPVFALVALVPVAPNSGKKGLYNLDLSKANVETSLLACLCNAICNCENAVCN